ncbi:recombinase family protein [Anaeromyxobacter dehalogenans]|nr:recombinase family protein [Anaeromyxobacter dehalogenans]
MASRPEAACYLRVSSIDGRQTVENQRADVARLAEARGFAPVFYEEQGSAKKKRPVLDRLMEDARTGRVRAVVVVALDRLDRDMRECINRIAKLDGYGCRVLSVRESWVEDAGQTRGLLVGIFGWMAEMERANLIARTKAGLARARREGKQLGRPRALLPVEVKKLRALIAGGMSQRKAAEVVGCKESTARLALKRGAA